MKYRSGWELVAAKHFDDDPLVASYAYEPFKIPYISNKKLGKIRNYIPDFLVEYVDGRINLIEVKRISALNQLTVKKKAEAAKQWAKDNNAEFLFWTDPIIKQLQKIQKAKAL
jgi:hypothetical protein